MADKMERGERINPDGTYNLYYPLNGPPKNERERLFLKNIIQQEVDDVDEALRSRSAKSLYIKEHAMSNCADFRLAVEKCIFKNDWFDSCMVEREAYDKCVEMQSANMAKLGFYKASFQETKAIVEEADAMFLRQCEEMNKK